jgi:hypothetical protein
MQTNTGELDYGTFSNLSTMFLDPYYGEINQTTPNNWKVQVLKNNSWVDAISFSDRDRRKDGKPVIGSDGYVEISYGLIIPKIYSNIFKFIAELSSETLKPTTAQEGDAYLVISNSMSLGTYHIWYKGQWKTFAPSYGWSLEDSNVGTFTSLVTDLTNPPAFTLNNQTKYKEFEYISGIRVVIDTMNKFDSTFDLIELSPRLVSDLSDRVLEFSLNKSASDLGVSGLPVGQLLASTGSISLFDFDDAFHPSNSLSIISKYVSKNIQIKLYEVITDNSGTEYYLPIKTMYSDGFPKLDNQSKQVSIELRDLYFYFESQIAPQMLLTNTLLI